MSHSDLARISVAEFIERFRAEMVPLSNTFSYFFAGLPLTEDDVKEYLEEPITALPPVVVKGLPKAHIILVPYLEKGNGKANGKAKRHGSVVPGSHEYIALEKPPEARMCTHLQYVHAHGADLLFAVKDVDMADYHYYFYRQIAMLSENALRDDVRAEYHGMLGDELSAGAYGEVDEQSWHLKQALRRRGKNVRRDTKAFREYARQSLIDTMTLYLHGICCDIDVETGPRQLPSRFLRKRLMWLEMVYPPPTGYAVFPEELEEAPRPAGDTV
jgi:hypothetical protein